MHILRSFARATARAALLLSAGAVPALAQSLPGSLVFSATGGSIPDNRFAIFAMQVSTPVLPGSVRGLTVRLDDFSSPAGGDLYADLEFVPSDAQLPSVRASLFSFAPGGLTGRRSFNGSYSIGTAFATPLNDGMDPDRLVRPGDYAARGDLFTLLSRGTLNGSWRVVIGDSYSQVSSARVGRVELAFDVDAVSTVPEPTTLVLLGGGLGVLGLAARRRRRVA